MNHHELRGSGRPLRAVAIAAIGACALALPGSALGGVVFSDRFARGDIDGWAATGRSVSVSLKGPVLSLSGDGVLYVPATLGLTDYLVEVEGRNINPVWGVGVLARANPNAAAQYGFTGYGFQYDIGAGGLRTLAFGGAFNDSDISPPRPIPNDGGWHRLALRVEGNRITTSLDGAPATEALNGIYTRGAAGLRVWKGNKAQYRHFRVSTLTEPSPAPTYVLSLGDAVARGWGSAKSPPAQPTARALKRRLPPIFDDPASAYASSLSEALRARSGSLQADWDNLGVSGFGAREIAGRAGRSPLLNRAVRLLERRLPTIVTVSLGSREMATLSGRCAAAGECSRATIRAGLTGLTPQVKAIVTRLGRARPGVPVAVTLLAPSNARVVKASFQRAAVTEINRRIAAGVAQGKRAGGARAFTVGLVSTFRGHGCGSRSSYFVTTSPVCSIPNELGHRAIATAILKTAIARGIVPR